MDYIEPNTQLKIHRLELRWKKS